MNGQNDRGRRPPARGRDAAKYQRDHSLEEHRSELIRKRVMPHSLDAEASILGGILLRNEVLALLPSLEVEDFYALSHKVVFTAIRNLEAKMTPIDVVTLEAEIEAQGKLDAVGGIAFLGELALRVPTADNIIAYAEIVVDHRITRDVILMLSDMMEEGYTRESTGERLVGDVATALMSIRTPKEAPFRTIAHLADAEAKRVYADLEARSRGDLVYAGVPTGVRQIDDKIGGAPIGVMTLLIARPAQGKTSFGMMFADHAKRIADMDSVLCSYEDGGHSFGQRGLAQESGLSTEQIRARKIPSRDDMHLLTSGHARSARREELFFDCAGLTVEHLIRRVRRENLRRKTMGQKPIRSVIVDYINKMPTPEWARTRDEGIGHISRTLSTFAATDDLAVVVMCQLNRENEKRDDHRPRMSDIRESGSLEQDGKVILGIYYPHQYEPTKYPAHEVYLLVLKNAQGQALTEIPLYWDRSTHTIYNSALDYQHARSLRGQ